MFWGKSKPKENPREKALKDLEATFPSIKKSAQNNGQLVTYELLFETVSKHLISLIVFIPSDFPTMKPSLL